MEGGREGESGEEKWKEGVEKWGDVLSVDRNTSQPQTHFQQESEGGSQSDRGRRCIPSPECHLCHLLCGEGEPRPHPASG